MRLTLAMLVAAIFTGCVASVPMAAPAADAAAKRFEVPADAALIYVVRKPQHTGGAILFRAAVDGKVLGGLAPATYRVATVSPGKHVVSVMSNENEETREIDAVAGGEYFVVVHARFGMGSARVGIEELTGETGDLIARSVVKRSTLAR